MDRKRQDAPIPGLSPKSALLGLVKGIVIGTGMILPGVSGGVLSVVLGVYRPMMAFFANPFKGAKRQLAFLLPVAVGWIAGVVLLSGVVGALFEYAPIPSMWLFVGLIAGSLPMLHREAGERGRGKGAWIALAAGAAFMLGLLQLLKMRPGFHIEPSLPWWVLCGVLMGLGAVLPGMSPAPPLIFLGLYQPMAAHIGAMDLGAILPLIAGALVTIVLLARGIKFVFERYYAVAYHAMVGITVGSLLAIIPAFEFSARQLLGVALCFVGIFIALWMSNMGEGLER